MTRFHYQCPACAASLSSASPPRPGGSLRCPYCGARFATVAEAGPVAPPPPPPPVRQSLAPRTDTAEKRRVSAAILLGLAGVGLVLLLGGLGLAAVAGLFRQATPVADLGPPPVPPPETGSDGAPRPAPASPPAPAPETPPSREPPPPPPPPVPTPVRTSLTDKETRAVNRAVDRGVAYLKAALAIDSTLGDPTPKNAFHLQMGFDSGSFTVGLPVKHPGIPPLIGLTLLACGLPAGDPVVQKAAVLTRAAAPNLTHCYSLSIAILFLDRLGERKDRELIQQLALQLVAGQTHAGGWGYNCTLLAKADRDNLLAFLRNPDRPAADNLRRLAVVEYKPEQRPVPRDGQMDDNSNTQFASLAMWVGRKHDLPMERTLGLVEARFRAGQLPQGTWDYASWFRPPAGFDRTVGQPFDANACAGLIGLAVGRGSSTRDRKKLSSDPQVKKALDYLGKAIGAPLHPPGKAPPLTEASIRGKYFGARAMGDTYFLWSVERVAVIYNLAKIGDRDWYRWGANVLVARQLANGSWAEYYPGIPDTCFALLFLRRTNVAPDLTEKLQKLEFMQRQKDDG